MERKIEKLIAAVNTWGFLFIANMALLPLWLRIMAVIGALVGCVWQVVWEVTDFVNARKEKKEK